MKMKMDMSKKKRAWDYDDDDDQAVFTRRKHKNIQNKRKPHDYLGIENSSNNNNNSAGEGCSVNFEHGHGEEEELIEIGDEKSVFDFPWSKEPDGGIVNILEDEQYLLALGFETTAFSTCLCKYSGVIDAKSGCDGATSLSDIPIGSSSDAIDLFPQQEKADIVWKLQGEPLGSSTLKVDELEGCEWINNLELTANATNN